MVKNLVGKHPNYFEAILQLRECSEQVYHFVKDEIHKLGLKIPQVKRVTSGYDYYTTDNSITRALGKRLQRKFGGHLLVTATLHTQKKGKELYRVTVMFRESGFKKGDQVNYNGEDYAIKALGQKEIFLQPLDNGRKVRVKYKEMSLLKKRKE